METGPQNNHSHAIMWIILAIYILALFMITSCTFTNREDVGPKWDAYRLEYQPNKQGE